MSEPPTPAGSPTAWYRYRVARRPEIVANIGDPETDVLEGVG